MFQSLESFEKKISFSNNPLGHCIFCQVEKELILYETQNLILLKDKYPITKNHLMITSKVHLGCLGELPLNWHHELNDLILKAQSHFNQSSYISYEHGRAGHCVKMRNTNIDCHHFHLHLLPQSVDISAELSKNFLKISQASFKDTFENYQKFGDYLLFRNSKKELNFFIADQEVESHLLRTLICQKLNKKHRSNWENLTL